MIDWTGKARALADHLAASGHLMDNQWRQAFQTIPRHLFVPRFWHDPATLLDGDDPATHAQWLQGVYSDQSLTTQYAPVPGTDLRWATSSSTKPSLMAHMLNSLNIHPGHTVLEIGTGTGYNAALLCHRLGDTQVTSIDIDPDLVADTRLRLATLGYHPTLLAGDGTHGAINNAPYDRVIATCAVPAIPPAWIDQLAPRSAAGDVDTRARTAGTRSAQHSFSLRPSPSGHWLSAPRFSL
jgi:protein-L-isoaspartate O-methyltransferase